jgi:signal transduction histidine kinase
VDLASLEKLKKEAYRLKELVLELLDAARAEQGKLVGEFREVNVVALAREVCARHNSPRHSCTVIADGEVDGLYAGARILQLLENLVENAVKYSPAGGPVAIKIWQEKGELGGGNESGSTGSISSQSGAWNRIAVTDSGIGIPKEDLPNVFERFHRGSNVDDRHFSGMGLGLFICLGIVEQHGGRIWVESPTAPAISYPAANNNGAGPGPGDARRGSDLQSNPGTTFHVGLPAIPATRPAQLTPVGVAGERPGRESTG